MSRHRRKYSPAEYARMAVSPVLYRKIIDPSTLNADAGPLKNRPIYEFVLREDEALLCYTTMPNNPATSKDMAKMAKPFKISTGLKVPYMYSHRWYKKRTPNGYVMGVKNVNRWPSFDNDSDRYQELFNELDIKMIRAVRDSALKKLRANKKLNVDKEYLWK